MGVLSSLLKERVIVLDGAMGTVIQSYNLQEADYRGKRFVNHKQLLKGHNDLLCLSKPEIISDIHRAYLEAGADIIETNTFNANAISLADYGMEGLAYELNFEGAKLAKAVAEGFSSSMRPRFVAGSIGPTNKTASVSPDVNNPAFRDVTYDMLVEAYYEQAKGLMDGGADILLVETIFDTLNAKAALFAIQRLFSEYGKTLPVMASATIADVAGRTFTGQSIEALYASLTHVELLSIGFNCGFGPEQLLPFVNVLDAVSSLPISIHPNAGLPDAFGRYTQTPEVMAKKIKPFLDKKLLNIIGGCCGTTPAHIKEIAGLAASAQARTVKTHKIITRIAGLEALTVSPENGFVKIGERANVSGSKRFARLIRQNEDEQAVSICRKQIEAGAKVIDVCMDDALIDGSEAMRHFLNLLAAEPDITKVPVMIDSSDFKVIETGLKCFQGKAIVNSISLKNGMDDFIEKAALVRRYGAAIVVMLFDEKGQADTYERKIEIAGRAYSILTNDLKFPPEDIIFDPNVLAVGTGMVEHAAYALDFINCCKWIKSHLPYAKVSGGISNLSFAFRGNDMIRKAMHAVFLFHAIKAGLDMAIVNPEDDLNPLSYPSELRDAVENIVLNRFDDATEKLLVKTFADVSKVDSEKVTGKLLSTQDRLKNALITGNSENIEQDMAACVSLFADPVDVISEVLMPAMNEVGVQFGKGKLFLPQVIKSARVMKKAVAFLKPWMDSKKLSDFGRKQTKILIATVKGDVHDIGKNIVQLVLSCNGFEMADLGVMVPAEKIVSEALAQKVDMVALSGLITPSLNEMVEVAEQMEAAGLKMPLLIGGAATSDAHTALKIAHVYSSPVLHIKDASVCVNVCTRLIDKELKEAFLLEVYDNYARLCEKYSEKPSAKLLSLAEARKRKVIFDAYKTSCLTKKSATIDYIDFPVQQLFNYFDWDAFYKSWDLDSRSNNFGKTAEALKVEALNMCMRIAKENLLAAHAVCGHFFALSENEDVLLFAHEADEQPLVHIPFLRNQSPAGHNNPCLADFVTPKAVGKKDLVGMFALGLHIREAISFENEDDALMLQILANHLAEAFSEFLHEKVCQTVNAQCGGPEISNTVCGIRPAIGYPSCPDHSLKAVVFELLNVSEKCGITLTENFAMQPAASVCGFYFFNAEAAYYNVGKIDEAQFNDYAARRGLDKDILRKTLNKNINF